MMKIGSDDAPSILAIYDILHLDLLNGTQGSSRLAHPLDACMFSPDV
jgi:hypothetical protein